LGFGAGAHSFAGETRSWNISNVDKYIQALQKNEPCFEVEYLTPVEQYNELVLLSLRTKNGIDLQYLADRFGAEKRNYFLEALQKIDSRFYEKKSDGRICITKAGLPLLDNITTDLMF
jgi:oxygen-independent coproporphyrinogen-3 oxidase